jgi:hypothetical protein
MLWGFSRWRLSDLGSGRGTFVFASGLLCFRPVAEGLLSVVCQFSKRRFWGVMTPSSHLVGSSCERVMVPTLGWFFVIVSSSLAALCAFAPPIFIS